MAKKRKTIHTKGEVRGWTDPKLVNSFFSESGSRAIIRQEILERMQADRYFDFFSWVQDFTPLEESVPGKVQSDVRGHSGVPRTLSGEKLQKELSAILNSNYTFSDLRDPGRCMEFCSSVTKTGKRKSRGDVTSLTEDELSEPQARMLGAIRRGSSAYFREHGYTSKKRKGFL